MRRSGRAWSFVLAGLFLLGACGSDGAPPRVIGLLDAAERTILDQPFSYPADRPAQVTAVILTLQPGEETGWHHHEAPLFAYILEGAVTVDYGSEGVRTYEAGQSIMEALNVSHNGRNEGDGPVRILAVDIGAQGVANTVADE